MDLTTENEFYAISIYDSQTEISIEFVKGREKAVNYLVNRMFRLYYDDNEDFGDDPKKLKTEIIKKLSLKKQMYENSGRYRAGEETFAVCIEKVPDCNKVNNKKLFSKQLLPLQND